jgi:VPS62-like protein
VLKYDSQESYFADAADTWTDNPGNVLVRADGTVIALAGDLLELAFLGPHTYGNGERAARGDAISDPTRDYRAQARRLHEDPRYANRVYGHAAVGGDGRQWLQYWFFYFYNDYNLIGQLVRGGLHEGDWEMIQLRLDGAGAPDYAVYAQHAGAEGRRWQQVDLLPGTQRPIVYVARGSHASYFEPGTHWTGHWFDYADGKRKSPEPTLEIVHDGDRRYHWVSWPGRWGDTKAPGDNPIDANSPRGPAAHAQWSDPSRLLVLAREAAEARAPRPIPPPAPQVAVRWGGAGIEVEYSVEPTVTGAVPTVLAVTVNSPDESAPPTTYTVEIEAPRGTIDVPGDADETHHYDVYVSAATADGVASESVRQDLEPR